MPGAAEVRQASVPQQAGADRCSLLDHVPVPPDPGCQVLGSRWRKPPDDAKENQRS
jgi:hypothetical protein